MFWGEIKMSNDLALRLTVIGIVALPITAFATPYEVIVATKKFTGTSELCVQRAQNILRDNGFTVEPARTGNVTNRAVGRHGDYTALILCDGGSDVVVFIVDGPKANTALDYDTNIWKAF